MLDRDTLNALLAWVLALQNDLMEDHTGSLQRVIDYLEAQGAS